MSFLFLLRVRAPASLCSPVAGVSGGMWLTKSGFLRSMDEDSLVAALPRDVTEGAEEGD